MIHKPWKLKEIEYLKTNYSNTQNGILAKHLNRTVSSVYSEAHILKLKKSKEFKSWLIGKRNKMTGRDLSPSLLQEIALKYKSRAEFQTMDPSAYSTARRLNLLDSICKHMIKASFSIPQLILQDILNEILKSECLYNSRKIIPPYEIDLFYQEFNLAFEYHGKRWHLNNVRDERKLKLFNEKGIKVFYLIENNRNYEEDIKNQLILLLPQINSHCNKNITKEQISNYAIKNPYKKVYNEEKLISVAKQYSSFKEFRTKEKPIYVKLSRMRLIDKATSHMEDRRKERNLEEVKMVVSKYEKLIDLIKNDLGAYGWIRKHGRWDLVSHIKAQRPVSN